MKNTNPLYWVETVNTIKNQAEKQVAKENREKNWNWKDKFRG